MNYDLVKELKEAGFPFDWAPDEYFYEQSPRPTLSELIEACGDEIAALTRKPKKWQWTATSTRPYGEYGCYMSADTAEEAVAKLWLALKAKDTQ